MIRLSRRWNFEKADEFVKEETNGECELLSIEKRNNRDCMKIACACGNEFLAFYYQFKKGKHKCNHCNGKSRYSIQQLKEFIELNSSCLLLSKVYSNNNNLLELKCSCGTEFQTTLKIFRNGKKQCDNCTNNDLAIKFSKSSSEFKEEVFALVGDEYTVISEYRNRKTKVELKHNTCRTEWFVNPSDFLHKNSRCPFCNESKGEKVVSKWLTSNNFSFLTQYKFQDCVNKRKLPFDFAVFKDGELFMLIEYDGKQHFQKGCFGVDNYEETKRNDKIKTDYCKNNHITLLRIPYTKFNQIETILENTLL